MDEGEKSTKNEKRTGIILKVAALNLVWKFVLTNEDFKYLIQKKQILDMYLHIYSISSIFFFLKLFFV